MPKNAKRNDTFKDFVLDQLASVDGVTCRAMFGGHGVYCRGAIFAIVFKNRLYFKTDAATCAKYTARNMGPFRPGPAQLMKNYHEVPGDVIEEAPMLCEWAFESIVIARSTAR